VKLGFFLEVGIWWLGVGFALRPADRNLEKKLYRKKADRNLEVDDDSRRRAAN
jgi:hypothetical protein